MVFLTGTLLNSAIFAQGFFEQEPYDPIENINRTTHEFNKGLDRYAIRPTSNVYGSYVPELIRIPIANFRGNLNEPKRFINHICLLYTSPSPRDGLLSRMPSSA